MQIFHFDRDEWNIPFHGSTGLLATRIATGEGPVRLTQLKVAPGGVIGTHPATDSQLFLVIAGSGWVAGPDGVRTPITAGQGAGWEDGEVHTSGSDTGLTALVVEGGPLALFEPEAPTEYGLSAKSGADDAG